MNFFLWSFLLLLAAVVVKSLDVLHRKVNALGCVVGTVEGGKMLNTLSIAYNPETQLFCVDSVSVFRGKKSALGDCAMEGIGKVVANLVGSGKFGSIHLEGIPDEVREMLIETIHTYSFPIPLYVQKGGGLYPRYVLSDLEQASAARN